MLQTEINVDKELLTKEVHQFADEAKKCIELYAKKNHDYGNSFVQGCDTIGAPYALSRIYDKTNRLINLSTSVTEVKDESIEDTLRDLACYSLMYLVYIHNKKVASIPNVEFE